MTDKIATTAAQTITTLAKLTGGTVRCYVKGRPMYADNGSTSWHAVYRNWAEGNKPDQEQLIEQLNSFSARGYRGKKQRDDLVFRADHYSAAEEIYKSALEAFPGTQDSNFDGLSFTWQNRFVHMMLHSAPKSTIAQMREAIRELGKALEKLQ